MPQCMYYLTRVSDGRPCLHKMQGKCADFSLSASCTDVPCPCSIHTCCCILSMDYILFVFVTVGYHDVREPRNFKIIVGCSRRS